MKERDRYALVDSDAAGRIVEAANLFHQSPNVNLGMCLGMCLCRRKMRMSGLCKVEMSAFMDGRGPVETERITSSQRERDRLKVLHEVQQKHLTQVEAAARLKVTDRQVRRMLLRIRECREATLVHGLEGRPSLSFAFCRHSPPFGF
jgi:hypothetical protein